MSAPEPPHVETLLEQCILALEAGDQPAMDSVLAANPAVAPLLRQRIEHLSVLGILKAPRPLVAIPDRLGEFRLLRQIGRGGMGVVYLAEQTSLQREVVPAGARTLSPRSARGGAPAAPRHRADPHQR
jgi:hypothetical protein